MGSTSVAGDRWVEESAVLELVIKSDCWDSPGTAVYKKLPYYAGDMGLMPSRRAKIPYTTEQLSLHAATTEILVHGNWRVHMLERTCMIQLTRQSQINKWIVF